jgi:MoaA/NifB/PqqE/SkfB family radical SAM enzyme
MAMSPPEFLFLSINEICNLRCQHCDYWRTKQPELAVMSLERQEEILREFAELSPDGKVVICGGEPMLDVNTYFRVCYVAHDLGLRVLSVVNGTMIASDAAAERVVLSGPDEISISLDGPNAEIHDRLRGRKGSFEIATKAVKLLLEARKARPGMLKVYVMGLLTASTYRHLEEWYHLVLVELGADKLKLNALQPTFMHQRLGQRRARDDFFAAESQVDPDALSKLLTACQEKFQLSYNPVWAKQVVRYFRGLYGRTDLDLAAGWDGNFATEEHICNSPLRNIMVDLVGSASLCFSNMFEHRKLERPGDLRAFWEEAVELRERMGKCNALCGISHSARREHSSLPMLAPSLVLPEA